jgi:hypothetical protein
LIFNVCDDTSRYGDAFDEVMAGDEQRAAALAARHVDIVGADKYRAPPYAGPRQRSLTSMFAPR